MSVNKFAQTATDNHWPLLDAIRFGAALLVLFGHARGLLLVGIARVDQPGPVTRALYLMSGLQHEGVVIFFVVSGFLIGGGIVQGMRQHRFNTTTYLLNRFVRIYLVFIPALALVFVLNILGMSLLESTRFYGERPLFPSGVFAGWTWDQIPCHFLTVQGVLCLPWGADPPLWTLGYEWAFYLIAPALFALLLLPVSFFLRVAGLATLGLVIAILSYMTGFFHIGFAIWLLGAGAHHVLGRKVVPLAAGVLGFVLCIAGLMLSRMSVVPLVATDIMVALGLSATVSCPRIMALPSTFATVRRGADSSYSLYLIHLPVCIFVGALMERYGGWSAQLVQPDLKGWTGFLVLVTTAVMSSWMFAQLTEMHTAAVRRYAVFIWNKVMSKTRRPQA